MLTPELAAAAAGGVVVTLIVVALLRAGGWPAGRRVGGWNSWTSCRGG